MAWHGHASMARIDKARRDDFCTSDAWHSMARHDMAWHERAQHAMAWEVTMAWHGTARKSSDDSMAATRI